MCVKGAIGQGLLIIAEHHIREVEFEVIIQVL